MTMFDAGASVNHRRHARRNLVAVAVAVGLGALISSAGAASARPLRDWVPQHKPAAFTDWRQAAELLPSTMVSERNAMLGTADESRLVYVLPGPGVDSATQSLLAKAEAIRAQQPVKRTDAKDHPGYGPVGQTRVWQAGDDTKDHPRYGRGGGTDHSRIPFVRY